jgi:hypothetical protein
MVKPDDHILGLQEGQEVDKVTESILNEIGAEKF